MSGAGAEPQAAGGFACRFQLLPGQALGISGKAGGGPAHWLFEEGGPEDALAIGFNHDGFAVPAQEAFDKAGVAIVGMAKLLTGGAAHFASLASGSLDAW